MLIEEPYLIFIKRDLLNFLPESEALIKRILSQMNNNRLSNSKAPAVDKDLIQTDIPKLLSRPSFKLRK
jgi:hypothetical protein